MKIFWQQYLTHFISHLFLMLVVMVLFFLDGYENFLLFGYGFFIFFILEAALLFRSYWKSRHFWGFLAGQKSAATLKKDTSPMSLALAQLIEANQLAHEQKTNQLLETQKQQQDFIELWVHQMKTPVTILTLLAQEDQVDPRQIAAETKRLKEGLDLALNMSRATSFEHDFHLQKLNLKQVVQQAIIKEKMSFIQREIYPKNFLPDLTVTSDEKWLAFILQQLLQNSLKYSPSHSQITFSATVSNSQVTILLTDYGQGIPKQDLPRVKEPFFTGTNGRIFPEATGMGLYLVDNIAKELAIDFSIASTQGVGTTFSLTFKKTLPS